MRFEEQTQGLPGPLPPLKPVRSEVSATDMASGFALADHERAYPSYRPAAGQAALHRSKVFTLGMSLGIGSI